MNNDTIFALSSGHGKSGVAVIRISGDKLSDIFTKMTHRFEFIPRHAYFTNLCDTDNNIIDQCLMLFFGAPNSFTGQDIIEIQCHGAPAVINKIFEYLSTLGMRMATPGEFSRRAFYNNKMDLADIDGLAALLDAQTDKQRQRALKSMLGRDSEIYNSWRTQMIEISAYAAATLDYSPDDLPADIGTRIQKQTKKLYDEINSALCGYGTARAIRGGINIVLVGETNVGKSSIFNYILGSNRAIVSDIAGTTRDVVSANLDIDGYMVNLSDTAGIRETDDTIESIGIERTKSEIETADIILNVYTPNNIPNIEIYDSRIGPNTSIDIVNKSDTIDIKETNKRYNTIYVSAKTGNGMEELMNTIRQTIHELFDNTESELTINARTKTLLESARDELSHAMTAGENYDIFAEHARRAADCIGKILGTITANDVLDMTFGQLCLGK